MNDTLFILTVLALMTLIVMQQWWIRRLAQRDRFNARLEKIQDERHQLQNQALRLMGELLGRAQCDARMMQLFIRQHFPPPGEREQPEPGSDADWWKEKGGP